MSTDSDAFVSTRPVSDLYNNSISTAFSIVLQKFCQKLDGYDRTHMSWVTLGLGAEGAFVAGLWVSFGGQNVWCWGRGVGMTGEGAKVMTREGAGEVFGSRTVVEMVGGAGDTIILSECVDICNQYDKIPRKYAIW